MDIKMQFSYFTRLLYALVKDCEKRGQENVERTKNELTKLSTDKFGLTTNNIHITPLIFSKLFYNHWIEKYQD